MDAAAPAPAQRLLRRRLAAGLDAWSRSSVIAVPLILAVAYLTLAERKVIGWMQVRIGPNRVGPLGLLQPFADVFKLMLQGNHRSDRREPDLFFVAPVLSIAPALAAWAVIPFDRQRWCSRTSTPGCSTSSR